MFGVTERSSKPRVKPQVQTTAGNPSRTFEDGAGSDLFASWLLDPAQEALIAATAAPRDQPKQKAPKPPKNFEINRFLNWEEQLKVKQATLCFRHA